MFSCTKVSAVDGDEDERDGNLPSTTKKPMMSKEKKNPFSSRGLDQFAIVSAELQARRQKIISQLCAAQTDNVTVWFSYSNSIGWVPIIFNQRQPGEGQDAKHRHHHHEQNHRASTGRLKAHITKPSAQAVASSTAQSLISSFRSEGKKEEGRREVRFKTEEDSMFDLKKIRTSTWFVMREANHEPLFVVVLVLLCLILLGRTSAILCTALWWYLGDAFKGLGVDGREVMETRSVVKKQTGDIKSDGCKTAVVGEGSQFRLGVLK